MLSDDRREWSGSSQAEAPKLISRFPGSFKEASESMMQQDQKHHAHAPQKEEGRGSRNKDSNLVSSCTFSLAYLLYTYSQLRVRVDVGWT